MPPKRKAMYHELHLAERDLKAVQAIVLFSLFSLLVYAILSVYLRDWPALVGLLPSATAACAALLVAMTATRLLAYNMIVRADDRAHDIVRITHHTMAVLNDLRGRVNYMKILLGEGNRPLVVLTKNAETIQRRYEALYDRELYRYLPGSVVDKITSLSSSVFGLSMLTEALVITLDSKGLAIIPSKNPTDSLALIQKISKLESELSSLFSEVESLRATIE